MNRTCVQVIFGCVLLGATISYAPVTLEPVNGAPENGVRVTTEVTNTGDRDGDDVAELYLTPPPFDGAPRLALRGLKRVSLKPGEHGRVVFELSPRDLSFVSADGTRRVMAGTYTVSVGPGQPDAATAHVSADFSVTKAVEPPE